MNQQKAWRLGFAYWVQFSVHPFRGAYVALLPMADDLPMRPGLKAVVDRRFAGYDDRTVRKDLLRQVW